MTQQIEVVRAGVSRALGKHLAIATVTIAAVVFVTLLPFLPGRYDRLAVPLSTMVQLAGFAGVLLVPVGVLWAATGRRGFAIAARIVAAIVALAAGLGGFAMDATALSAIAIAISGYAIARWVKAPDPPRAAVVVYLVIVPVAALLLQRSLIGPAIERSRARAIANAAPLIAEIERYREANGRYPESLLAEGGDILPNVVGIAEYEYEPKGEGYNVIFEQFAKSFGAREFVVYNTRGEHAMTAHRSDRLRLSPAELVVEQSRGHFASGGTPYPHWKWFLFD